MNAHRSKKAFVRNRGLFLKIVFIEELMWSYHPLPKDWITVPFADVDSIETADILVQSNPK